MTKEHSELVKEHFEMKYNDYDKLIQNLIPKYTEMHNLVVELVDFPKENKLSILDLGVGTGQTALSLLQKFPNAILDGIDISPKMIEQAKIRLKNFLNRITFSEQDIKDLQISRSYDACVAVLSIHHLNEKQKPELFRKIFDNLNENGVFAIGDIIKFDSEKVTKEKEEEWRNFLIKNLGEKEGQYWFENYQEEDLPSSVSNQLEWLRQAGFKEVKCIWEHMNYAVFFGRK
ncbi:MAG: class I SAM-dependent methyltransferase [Candidatus Nanoarchaeia archaeon]|nr:class I SAM-dependent methyltransferase [Candidatus Nanoarchaeia archaeon]